MSLAKGMPCHITAMGDESEMSDREIKNKEIDYRNGVTDYAMDLINGDVKRGYNSRQTFDFSNAIEEIESDTNIVNALRSLLRANTGEQSAKAAYLLKNLLHIKVHEAAESLYESHRQDGVIS